MRLFEHHSRRHATRFRDRLDHAIWEARYPGCHIVDAVGKAFTGACSYLYGPQRGPAESVPRPGLAESRVAVAGPGHSNACPNCGRPGYDGRVCGRCGWGYGYQPAHEAAVAAIYAPGQLPVTPQDDDATDIFSLPRVSARREARNIWGPPRAETWAQRTVDALMAEYFGGPVLKAIPA